MSTKIFNIFFCKNLKSPKHFHLYPLHRSSEKNPNFTRLGDTGTSKIYSGNLSKDHIIFEAIGATGELNAFIGLAREFVKEDEKLTPLSEILRKIQLVLVDVGEIVSGLEARSSSVNKTKPPSMPNSAKITNKDIADLETLISQYTKLLPPIETTIIPGGGKASASLHVAKAICRRCERILVNIFKDMNSEKEVLAYMNRLSSYLCHASRIANKFANRSETIYKPSVKSDTTTSDK